VRARIDSPCGDKRSSSRCIPELSDLLLDRIFGTVSHVGLVLLVFLVGLEFDFIHLRTHGRAALGISLTGILLPFGLGVALAPLIHPLLEAHPGSGQPVPLAGFTLFLGVALSITALPVLGRMMVELGITRTRLGTITITAAAVDDAIGWILLAAAAAVVRAELSPAAVALRVAFTTAFCAVMFLVVRPLLLSWVRRQVAAGALGAGGIAVLLVVLVGGAIATSWIGIYSIFGAFVLGAVLSDQIEFRDAVNRRLHDLITAFFLPIFFTYTGLRTNVGSISGAALWSCAALVLAAAVIGKLGGCALAARLTGFDRREAAMIGLMMNTRGLVGLVVVNQGYEMRVIPPSAYCMLVLVALLTTVVTTPALLAWMEGTELEEPIRRSGFLGRRTG
jgi:Kef-type K+ transport system membrane component KefB